MNLEQRLNDSLNDILRASGYIYEILNANKRQSNLVTGPNNQIISPGITTQLSKCLSNFNLILDETVSKFNDAPWCIEQIVQNKRRQEEQKIQEELERQRKVELDRKQKEELEEMQRKTKAEEERKAREEAERAASSRAKEERERNERELQQNQQAGANLNDMDNFPDLAFDLDMDMAKELDIPNPSDILLSISYTGGNNLSGFAGDNSNADDKNMDLDMNTMIGGDLDDLGMDLLNQDYEAGLGGAGDEEFDVDNFLNQFGNGD